jgi:Flp pilus assembly pilin Flp
MRSFDVQSTVSGRFDLVRRFISDDSGQDLIEYAFLAASLATAGYLALNAIRPTVGNTYNTWVSPTTGSPSLWQPAEPWTTAGS